MTPRDGPVRTRPRATSAALSCAPSTAAEHIRKAESALVGPAFALE